MSTRADTPSLAPCPFCGCKMEYMPGAEGGPYWGHPAVEPTCWLETAWVSRSLDGEGGVYEWNRRAAPTPPAAEAHPDDLAVDQFAATMKAKLAVARDKGRGGWEDRKECPDGFLSQLLREHVEKGDPVDVANLAMMLSLRGERIAQSDPIEPWVPHLPGINAPAAEAPEILLAKIAELEDRLANAEQYQAGYADGVLASRTAAAEVSLRMVDRAVAAAEAPGQEPVAVKPLEWTQSPPPAHDHEPFVYWAAGLGGHYRAERDGMLWMAHDAFVWEQHASQREAQAAAQGDHAQRVRSALISAPPTYADAEAKFRIGDRVTKIKGSSWTGRVVGTYRTALTPEGYAVESETEIGSVQIYPVAAIRSLASPAPKESGQ